MLVNVRISPPEFQDTSCHITILALPILLTGMQVPTPIETSGSDDSASSASTLKDAQSSGARSTRSVAPAATSCGVVYSMAPSAAAAAVGAKPAMACVCAVARPMPFLRPCSSPPPECGPLPPALFEHRARHHVMRTRPPQRLRDQRLAQQPKDTADRKIDT